MTKDDNTPMRVRWARLRFQIIGPLLASPPEAGELAARLDELAAQTYVHPSTGARVHFGRSTIERWLYIARNHPGDPIGALARKLHARAGSHPTIGPVLAEAIRSQHRAHPRWSWQLHHDNLVAWAKTEPTLGRVPSYTTLRRYMKSQSLMRARNRSRSAARQAGAIIAQREMRSYEVTHCHSLWHTDGHVCSRRVLVADGQYREAHAIGVMDDHSRLCCHLQWYLGDECAETVVHCLMQAIQKRGLPRALLSDGGSGFNAAETTEGLERLSVVHHTTLPRTPEQNAKQEVFWAQVEGRLMPMLEGQEPLTLGVLNLATVSWFELEYNRKTHSEIGQSPLSRFLEGPSVGRPSPSSQELRLAFRHQELRTQRRSDGTLTVLGVRFEIPSRYRTLARPAVRYTSWDLSSATFVDPRSGAALCEIHPLDRAENATGRRRAVEPVAAPATPASPGGIAPLLRELMNDYAATGLPPAYVPLVATAEDHKDDSKENS
jgi:transposase InsO family protein